MHMGHVQICQTHQDGAPADRSDDHDQDELNHHLHFMVSAPLAPVLSTAHLDQGHHTYHVQQKRHGDAYQSDQCKNQGEGHVFSLRADVEKTPRARLLYVVAPNAC